MNTSQDPIMADEESSISSQSGSTSSKKWKKSTIIFGGIIGGIIGLLILISIVFSIFTMVENSSLKHEVSTLEAKLELEIETREHEDETLSDAIENIKSFVNYTGKYILKILMNLHLQIYQNS